MHRLCCLFATLLLTLTPVALSQDPGDRPREAVDDSLDLDREVIAGLERQAERLRQTARDVMAAPGARSTAKDRFRTAATLNEAAGAFSDEISRLRAADERLLKAVQARADARAALREAIESVSDVTRTGVFEEIELATAPVPELLDARTQTTDALQRAERLSEQLVPRDTLVIGFQLLEDNPAVRDTFLIAVTNVYAGAESSATVSREESGYTEVTGLFPRDGDLGGIRTGLMNALRVETEDGSVRYLPALLSVTHEWQNGGIVAGEPLQTLLQPVIEGDVDTALPVEGSGD
jgi:hypothetical protein